MKDIAANKFMVQHSKSQSSIHGPVTDFLPDVGQLTNTALTLNLPFVKQTHFLYGLQEQSIDNHSFVFCGNIMCVFCSR